MKPALVCASLLAGCLLAATTQPRYFAHTAVEDEHGVIAPWYKGQNGQFDYRIRIAAETIKRYPWTTREKAVAIAPEYVFNNTWRISPEGTITVPPLDNWTTGAVGQANARVIMGLVEYTGTAATRLPSLTSPWPRMFCCATARRPLPTLGRGS
jgi:hypothetical protein